jgi:hypothetical protein
MAAISVLLDSKLLATVNSSEYDVVSVQVHGTKIDTEFAMLEMSGGKHPEKGDSTHLIWINGHVLGPGQRIEVRFEETGETFPKGKTIDELFPKNEASSEPVDFKPTEAIFTELRAMPHLRESYSFKLQGAVGTEFIGSTAAADHGFGFSLLWNSFHPERASYSLHAYTLSELEARSTLRDFVQEYVEAPYALNLQVDA